MTKKQPKRRARSRAPAAKPAPALPAIMTGDQVLTVRQWAALNAISYRTARRILDAGEGPRILQLTAGRIGIRVRDNAAWQEARARV
jgi:hypothetical protein